MKTRKQNTPVSRRARQQPAQKPARKSLQRSAARRPSAAVRGKAAGPKSARSRPDRPVTLAAECTVAEADALKSELAGRLDEPGPVTVDVSALQRIDTAGLQLLAAFVRDRREAGRAVEWHGQAPALQAAAGILGLNNMLELAREAGR